MIHHGSLQLPAAIERQFPASLRLALIALRRQLHRHPELSGHEDQTATRLTDALSPLAPAELRRVAATGVVARIRGRDSHAPTVAIRGDIDALPIQEDTGLEFASENPGVMHACGHDVHASWAVGAAHLLAESPAHGDVLIVLQPSEETGQGARAVLATGALDGVKAIFGAHVDRRFPIGQVVAQTGPLAASADNFIIELEGSGAHAARPHESADPIVGLGALISALQTIVSRRVNPAHAAVVTIGTVQAGTAPNIIPGRATISGTLRATDSDTRRLLEEELRRIADGVAATHRLHARIMLEPGTPPIVNPPDATRWARDAAVTLLGEDAVVPLGFLNLAGEDFAHYLERIPGCFLRIGARENGGETIPAHTPRFYAADESIFVGAAVLAETARVASQALARA
ncbi:MAG: amidohydrolase [Anaerolineae bacterium]|nr:amidohydrolase [Gemmatimonadaceae bacterium]